MQIDMPRLLCERVVCGKRFLLFTSVICGRLILQDPLRMSIADVVNVALCLYAGRCSALKGGGVFLWLLEVAFCRLSTVDALASRRAWVNSPHSGEAVLLKLNVGLATTPAANLFSPEK